MTPTQRISSTSLCVCLLCAAFAAPAARADVHIAFPPEAGLVNVRDHGAVGDGVADDTAAIRAAVVAAIEVSRYRANPFVYLPNGTYKVSGPIEGRVGGVGTWSAGWRPMMLMMGESREGATIRLADNAPGYGEPSKPRWVIACGSEGDKRDNEAGGGNRAFRHSFVNFTVDVGAGNPGAVAIDFVASNRGCIEDVTLRAAPGSGHTGIGLTRPWPGPAYIGNVSIDGFDTAIRIDHYQYGMTFEGLTLRNQRSVGIRNTNNMLAMRKVDFVGSVPFYVAGGGSSFLSLLDSTLVAETPQPAAIQAAGFVNLRRVRFAGFGTAVDDTGKTNRDLAGAVRSDGSDGSVGSWDLGATFSLQGTAAALSLPIEDAPQPRPGPSDAWTYGGTTLADLQAAIDGGAEWVFIRGSIPLDEPLVLRGKLRLLMGLSAHLKGTSGKVAVRVEDGSADAVVLEHIYIDGIVEQVSSRTFALRHGDLGGLNTSGGGLQATGAGQTHLVDVIGKGYQIGPKHRFWGRQINAEFGDQPLVSNAGDVWILGFKMEGSKPGDKDGSRGTPCFLNRAGGRMEVFASLLYTLGSDARHRPEVPAFTNERGSIAISYRHNGAPTTWYDQILRVGTGADAETIRNDRIGGPGRALLSDAR